jgi:hypothetical protein
LLEIALSNTYSKYMNSNTNHKTKYYVEESSSKYISDKEIILNYKNLSRDVLAFISDGSSDQEEAKIYLEKDSNK